ncbi:MAG: DUF5915 domain-containing protein, partial [Calditrichia bacterium]
TRKAKPNYKKLGPRFGKSMGMIADIISNWSAEEIDKLERNGSVNVHIEGQEAPVNLGDIEIYEETTGNYALARDGGLTIALNLEITPDLELEGLAREFVNRIQNLRKESKLEVTDRIEIYYQAPDKINQAASELADYIKAETLAVNLNNHLPDRNEVKTIKIGKENLSVVIRKVQG